MPTPPPAAEYLAQHPTISRYRNMVYVAVPTFDGVRQSCISFDDYRKYIAYARDQIREWDEEDRNKVRSIRRN